MDREACSTTLLEKSAPVSIAIDGIAAAALVRRRGTDDEAELFCDACDAHIEGEPAGRGLYMWTRGDEVRFEEPALCEGCATAIGMAALARWAVEDEEG